MSKKYEELDFTDNFFFCKILMKNKKLCIELLELILKIKIKDIVFMAEQKPIEITADGRGVRLDVYVEDDAKTVYDIERGADFNELKKSYVIFICLDDPFDKGLHVYTFENWCREFPGLQLGDETTKVFINAAGTADDISDEMKDFLDYLKGKGAKSDFVRRIDEEVIKARTHTEWRVEYMSLILRDHEKLREGEERKMRAIVMNMLKKNIEMDTICEVAECDEAYVENVEKELAE